VIAHHLPPQPTAIVVAQRHPVARPPAGAFYQARPIHGGYREGRPSPSLRYGPPVQVLGGSKGPFPRAAYFQDGPRVRTMPTRQFNQRFTPYVPGR